MGRDAGALPQTLPEALPLDSARGNCPLTLFGLPGLVTLPNLVVSGAFACPSPLLLNLLRLGLFPL